MAIFKEITSSQELEQILAESCQRQIILFKHSTTCPTSSRALREVQNFIQESQEDILVGLIKVIESRSLSNQAAEELEVKHQSPQVLLVRDREVFWHASHQEVTQTSLIKALEGDRPPLNLLN